MEQKYLIICSFDVNDADYVLVYLIGTMETIETFKKFLGEMTDSDIERFEEVSKMTVPSHECGIKARTFFEMDCFPICGEPFELWAE